MTARDALAFLLTPAGIGVAVSWLLEQVESFGALSPKAKRLLVMLLTFLIPLATTMGMVGLGWVAFSWEAIIVAFVAAFSASQAWHTKYIG